MLNFKNFDHININVSNLKESIKFYQKVFNFEVKEEGQNGFGKPYAIIGISQKGFLCLYENSVGVNDRYNHIGFYIEDLPSKIEELNASGVEIIPYGDEQGIVNYPKSISVYIKDPDGNNIELSSQFGGGL